MGSPRNAAFGLFVKIQELLASILFSMTPSPVCRSGKSRVLTPTTDTISRRKASALNTDCQPGSRKCGLRKISGPRRR